MKVRRRVVLGLLLVACGPNVSEGSGDGGSSGEGSSSTDVPDPTTVADSGTSMLPEETSSSSGEPFVCDPPSSCEACQSWQDTFDGRSGDQDWFSSLLLAANGDVVALGVQNASFLESAGAEARIVRYSADGTLLWERVLDGTPQQAASGAFDADGSIDVVLARSPSSLDTTIWLARLSGDGEVLQDPALLSDGSPRQLVRADGGDLLLLSQLLSDVDDVQLGRIVDGVAEQVGPDELQEFAGGSTRLALGPAGSVFVAGETDDGAPRLRRLSPEGAEWIVDEAVDTFEGFSGEGRVADVKTLADGSVVYALASRSAPIRVGRIGPLGAPVWAADVEGLPCCNLEPRALSVDADDRVFLLVGASNASEQVIAISPCDGATQWVWEEEASKARSFGNALVSGAGGLFLAGSRGVKGTDLMAWIEGFTL